MYIICIEECGNSNGLSGRMYRSTGVHNNKSTRDVRCAAKMMYHYKSKPTTQRGDLV